MLHSWVIEWSESWIPHERTFRDFTHLAWVICDLSNHDLFQIISDPGSQQRVSLSLESICTIPFQARASDVKMPKLRQHSSNCGMPYFVNVFGTFQGPWDHSDETPGALFRCLADIFSNITKHEIERPRMLIARKIGQVSLVRCTCGWHNCCSCRKWILCIPPPVTRVHLAIHATSLRVREVYRFKIVLSLKLETY